MNRFIIIIYAINNNKLNTSIMKMTSMIKIVFMGMSMFVRTIVMKMIRIFIVIVLILRLISLMNSYSNKRDIIVMEVSVRILI